MLPWNMELVGRVGNNIGLTDAVISTEIGCIT